MNATLSDAMISAMRLVSQGRLSEATKALQTPSGSLPGTGRSARPKNPGSIIEDIAEESASLTHRTSRTGPTLARAGGLGFAAHLADGDRPPASPICGIFGSIGGARDLLHDAVRVTARDGKLAESDGLSLVTRRFQNKDGSRVYKLFVPSTYRGQAVPLIVMLHGCTQSADDFAAGTRMNVVAEEHQCLVIYPEQSSGANMQKCWNWFNENDQQRDLGEPSLIAGITREVMNEYNVDRTRVYVAGLSAGGAAAAILGEVYPDLFAAVGVHSGLPRGAAHDMPSAFAAMRGTSGGGKGKTPRGSSAARMPTIVFHGDRDTTVSPTNSQALVLQAASGESYREHEERHQSPGGLSCSVTRYRNGNGLAAIEKWIVHGAAHAWSGGSSAGSYTEPRGPDATREMVRFFLEHPRHNI
jgi:poly(hydroxyalkanoate) depolymerase family esterase